jgi:hypothetical protein
VKGVLKGTMISNNSRRQAIMATSDSLERITSLLHEVEAVLRGGKISAIALELPSVRVQSHDDEKARVEVPYEIGTAFGLWSNAHEQGRHRTLLRATPAGAVVVTGKTTWVLVRADLISNPLLATELFPSACVSWGHEAILELDTRQRDEDDRANQRGKYHWRNRNKTDR